MSNLISPSSQSEWEHPMLKFCNDKNIILMLLFKETNIDRSEFHCRELDTSRDVFDKFKTFESRIGKSGECEMKENHVTRVDEIEISFKDFRGLKGPGTLINDNIINAFCILLQRKLNIQRNGRRMKVFDTFFYSQLVSGGGYDYDNVANHFPNVDVFELDNILIPIFVSGCHWGLIFVCLKDKKMHYFDSLRFDGMFVMMNVLKWLFERNISRHREGIDISEWQLYDSAVGPSSPQKNGVDCGVFLMMYMDCICHETVLNWIKEDIIMMSKYRNYVARCLLANELCE